MRPNQCGTFAAAALPIMVGLQHELRIHAIATGRTTGLQRQLLPGLGFTAGDLVKVTEHYQHGGIDLYGRVGQVVGVHDYRGLHYRRPEQMQAVITVRILAGRHNGQPAWLPGAAGLEPHEIARLHEGAGDWTKLRRVVSPANWPAARDGIGA